MNVHRMTFTRHGYPFFPDRFTEISSLLSRGTFIVCTNTVLFPCLIYFLGWTFSSGSSSFPGTADPVLFCRCVSNLFYAYNLTENILLVEPKQRRKFERARKKFWDICLLVKQGRGSFL